MSLRCPICTQTFAKGLNCPRCHVMLMPQTQADLEGMDPVPPHWSRNPWGRTILGVIIAQGLYHALAHLLQAGHLAAGDDVSATFGMLLGLLSNHALQLVALLVGSFFAGAGQRNAVLFGALVGVWNAVAFTVTLSLRGEPYSPVTLYALPLIHAAVGGIGGVMGSWFWKPPALQKHAASKLNLAAPLASAYFQLSEARIHWLRIALGVTIVVAGHLSAESLLYKVVRTTNHALSVRNSMEEWFLTLEISALACFIGGAIAGATTRSGGVQGGYVGIASLTVFVGMRLANRLNEPLLTFVLMMGGMLALCFLGGAFGGRLLPPVVPKRKSNTQAALAV